MQMKCRKISWISTVVMALLVASPAHGQRFGPWLEPVNLGSGVNTDAFDQSPSLSKDGLTLYFTSFERSGGFGNYDIWVSQRACRHCQFGSAANLGSNTNTPFLDGSPNFSEDELTMFFVSNRPGGFGGIDIWVSHRTNPADPFDWSTPVNIGPDVNTATQDLAPWFAKKAANGGHDLYFNRGRAAFGEADIYVTPVTADGQTLGPAVAVTELNASVPYSDANITLRKDGKEAFFWSDRPGTLGDSDIYTATRDALDCPWSVPVRLGTPPNSLGSDLTPTLSSDGLTLIFASDRAGGYGNLDLWMTTRKHHGDDVAEDKDKHNGEDVGEDQDKE